MSDKQRLIEAQAALTVARRLLEKIAHGHSRNPEAEAHDALDEMYRVGRKAPLQGIVGHAPTPSRHSRSTS